LRTVKKWNRDFANHVGPLAKQLEKLQTVLTNNLPQAIAAMVAACITPSNDGMTARTRANGRDPQGQGTALYPAERALAQARSGHVVP